MSPLGGGFCCPGWMLAAAQAVPFPLQAFQGKRDGMPPHIFSVAQRAYWSMLMQRQDQTIMPLGRSGAGKTSCCMQALEYLVATAGSLEDRVTGMPSRGATGHLGGGRGSRAQGAGVPPCGTGCLVGNMGRQGP